MDVRNRNFHQIARPRTVRKTSHFTQISLCWGPALTDCDCFTALWGSLFKGACNNNLRVHLSIPVPDREAHTPLLPCLLRFPMPSTILEFPGEGVNAHGQTRVDLATSRAVPARTWGHCPQVLLFTVVWDTLERKKLPNGLLPPSPHTVVLEGFN